MPSKMFLVRLYWFWNVPIFSDYILTFECRGLGMRLVAIASAAIVLTMMLSQVSSQICCVKRLPPSRSFHCRLPSSDLCLKRQSVPKFDYSTFELAITVIGGLIQNASTVTKMSLQAAMLSYESHEYIYALQVHTGESIPISVIFVLILIKDLYWCSPRIHYMCNNTLHVQ